MIVVPMRYWVFTVQYCVLPEIVKSQSSKQAIKSGYKCRHTHTHTQTNWNYRMPSMEKLHTEISIQGYITYRWSEQSEWRDKEAEETVIIMRLLFEHKEIKHLRTTSSKYSPFYVTKHYSIYCVYVKCECRLNDIKINFKLRVNGFCVYDAVFFVLLLYSSNI